MRHPSRLSRLLVCILAMTLGGHAAADTAGTHAGNLLFKVRPDPYAADIRSAMDDYARALCTLPADSVAARFTIDGRLLLPDYRAVFGRAAIYAYLAPLADSVTVDSIVMKTELVEGNDRFQSQWGSYRQVAGPKGRPHGVVIGRYSALWQYYDGAGVWLLNRLLLQPLPYPTPDPPGTPESK